MIRSGIHVENMDESFSKTTTTLLCSGFKIYKNCDKKSSLTYRDYRMPIKNGTEIATEILANNKKPNVILISADTSIIFRARSIGAFNFLSKLFKLIDLENTIESALYNENQLDVER